MYLSITDFYAWSDNFCLANKHFLQLGEGYLTVETLSSILLELEPDLSDEQLKEIIDEVDEDGSGTIDYDGNFHYIHQNSAFL